MSLFRYEVKTNSLRLAVSGCSFECYKEVEVRSCCPGYWGPDCFGKFRNMPLKPTGVGVRSFEKQDGD